MYLVKKIIEDNKATTLEGAKQGKGGGYLLLEGGVVTAEQQQQQQQQQQASTRRGATRGRSRSPSSDGTNDPSGGTPSGSPTPSPTATTTTTATTTATTATTTTTATPVTNAFVLTKEQRFYFNLAVQKIQDAKRTFEAAKLQFEERKQTDQANLIEELDKTPEGKKQAVELSTDAAKIFAEDLAESRESDQRLIIEEFTNIEGLLTLYGQGLKGDSWKKTLTFGYIDEYSKAKQKMNEEAKQKVMDIKAEFEDIFIKNTESTKLSTSLKAAPGPTRERLTTGGNFDEVEEFEIQSQSGGGPFFDFFKKTEGKKDATVPAISKEDKLYTLLEDYKNVFYTEDTIQILDKLLAYLNSERVPPDSKGSMSGKDSGVDTNIWADPNKLVIPYGISVDKGSMKSVFGGNLPPPLNNEETVEKHATSIRYKNQVYTNIRYLNNCPPILMYNDLTISDLFYNTLDVKRVVSEMDRARNKKEPPNKNLEISVIFSKAFTTTYTAESIYDEYEETMDDLIRIMVEIEQTVGHSYNYRESNEKHYKYQAQKTGEKKLNTALGSKQDQLKLVALYDGEPTTDAYPTHSGMSADQVFDTKQYPKLLELDNKFSELLDKLLSVMGFGDETMFDSKIKDNFLNWPRYATKVNKDVFTVIHPKERLFLRNKEEVNPAWEFAKDLVSKRMDEAKKLQLAKYLVGTYGNRVKGSSLDQVIFYLTAFLNQNKLIKFLTQSEKTQFEAYIKQGSVTTDELTYIKELVGNIQTSIAAKTQRIFESPDKIDGKKVLYFYSTIRPFNASWVMTKACGQYGALGGKIIDLGKGIINVLGKGAKMISKLWAGKSNLTADENQDMESIAKRMAEARVTPARYLLTRATVVGLTLGDDDVGLYQFKRPQVPSKCEDPKVLKGGFIKQNAKTAKKGKKQNKTRKLPLQKGGGDDPAEITWYDLKRTTILGRPVAQSISFNAILGGCIAAGIVIGTGGLGALAVGPIVGAGIGAGIGAGLTAANSLQAGLRGGNTIIMTDVERFLFNDFLGMWFQFSSPEDNVDIINLLFAVVFGGDTLELKTGREATSINWAKNFPLLYSQLYESALENRIRKWCQIAEYSTLIKQDRTGHLNLKEIIQEEDSSEACKKTDYSNYLCYYMDASYIAAAIKSYPTTWNPKTGQMLEDYNKNRTKFLEDLAKKEEKKK
jgi:hypothetical protein